MVLKKRYVIGCLVMFYEIEMLSEYVDSIIQALEDVENPENVTVEICFNLQEYLESPDWDKITPSELDGKVSIQMARLFDAGVKVEYFEKYSPNDPFYNIAQYRRDLNYKWCDWVDYVLWGETDSLWPKQTFMAIERVDEYARNMMGVNRFVITFAYRKNWDRSWDIVCHPMFRDVQYQDTDDWMLNNEASSKSYMSLERMNEINDMADPESWSIQTINKPKFDGSCLVISSDLIKCGVNIPHALTHCAEDTSFGRAAEIMLGEQYRQYIIQDILRVHNRRHPRKRMYIKGENNPYGFVGDKKGPWWDILERTSKHNLSILTGSQDHFITLDEMMAAIHKVK